MAKEKKELLVGKNKEELKKLLVDAKNELFNLRLDKTMGKLKNTSSLFIKRKEIARIKSKMREMELIHHE